MALKKIAWWQWIPVFGWRVVGTCEAADEVPHKLPRNGAVLVVSGGVQKWIAFDCACRTGHRILLPLQGSPRWRVGRADPLTIAPSVDSTGARRCHYIVRDGRIHWA